MTRRILISLAVLALLLTSRLAGLAQDTKTKDPESKHAVDLRARKATEPDFTKDTKRFGVEVYTDGPSGDAIYIGETGTLSVMAAKQFKAGDGKGKDPLWQHGLTLSVRSVGEKDWDKAKKIGIEVFKDENNGNLVYLTDGGDIDAVPNRYATATDKGKPKSPKWKHAMDLKVRKAGEKDFTKDTKKVAIEVYHDENNGNLVYLTDAGSIAVASSKLSSATETGKGPDWQHGLELKVRKAGEKEFTKDTKTYGIEVFLDGNNGNLIYVCETGGIAVVPGKFAKLSDGKSKAPELKHAIDLSVRKAGQKEFAKGDKKYGIEVYADENNGNLIYIADNGEMSVVSPKAE